MAYSGTATQNSKKYSGPSALVINPRTSVARKLVESLIASEIAVTAFGEIDTLKKFSMALTQNPYLTLAFQSNASPLQEKYNYTIVFGDGLDETSLENFFKQTGGSSKNLFVLPISWGEVRLRKFAQKTQSRVVVVVPGIGPDVDTDTQDLPSQVFRSLISREPLALKETGNENLYLAATTDTVDGLLQALFTADKLSITWLIPPPITPQKFLKTARLFSSAIPSPIAGDSKDHHPLNQSPVPDVPYWTPQTPLEEAIRETIIWINKTFTEPQKTKPMEPTPLHHQEGVLKAHLPGKALPEKPPLVERDEREPTPPQTEVAVKMERRWPVYIAIVLLVSLLILPTIVASTLFQLAGSVSLASQGKVPEAHRSVDIAYQELLLINQSLLVLRPVAATIGLGRISQSLEKKFSTLESLAFAEQSLFRLGETGKKLFIDQTQDASIFPALAIDANAAADAVSLASLSLAGEKGWMSKIPFIGQKFASSYNSLLQGRSLLLSLQKVIPVFPDLAGYNNPRTYLILFQNNMELRPTGGFIGSYGLATLNRGQLTNVEVHDVYSADGQLKGHVEPPVPIKNILGEAGWFLRDSNWDPDFQVSAQRAEWFLEKETGRSVDGTIGITLNLAQALLRVTGPVRLLDFDEDISAENIYERAQYHAEANFFPGSTQKKDFLGSVAKALLERLKKASSGETLKLGHVFEDALNQRDIQVFFHNPQTQSVFAGLRWSGAVLAPKECLVDNCLSDFVYIVDSNLGVNKGNYFLKKHYSEKISLTSQGEVVHTLIGEFQNTATSESWPAGRYKTYIRLYFPEGSILGDALVRGSSSDSWTRVSLQDTYSEHQKQVKGFTLDVPIKEGRTFSIAYKSPSRIDMTKKGALVFYWQKQAGASTDQISWALTAPSGLQVIAPGAKESFDIQPGVEYNQTLSFDQLYQVDLIPQGQTY